MSFAAPVSSGMEIVETMLEASIVRMNWLVSDGYTAASAGSSTTWRKVRYLRQTQRSRCLDLAMLDGLQPRPDDFREIRAGVERQRQQPRRQWRIDAHALCVGSPK